MPKNVDFKGFFQGRLISCRDIETDDKLTSNGYRSAESVFVDFLTLSSCSYSNVFDRTNKEAREKRYLDIVKKYKKEELNYFSTALGELTMAAEIYLQHGYIKDILGYIYTTGQYYKKSMGQYFTPDSIAIFMSDDAVGVSAIHEIIVRTVSQALESEFLRSIHEF